MSRIKRNLSILVLCFYASASFASKQCEQDQVTQVLNIGFTYPDSVGLSKLNGVKIDQGNFKKINKGLYGADAKNETFSDKDLDYDKNLKEDFLDKIRAIAKKNKGGKAALNFSGHGIRCQKPGEEMTWCLSLPSKTMKLTRNDVKTSPDSLNEAIVQLNDKMKNNFVTVKELNDAYPTKIAIIDSCHSGQMAIEMSKIQGNNGDSTFVFASTVGSNVAVDDKETGGRLMSAINNLVSADDRDFCKLDLDRDGMVSEREAFASIFSHNATRSLRELGGEIDGVNRKTALGQFSTSQLALGNPSDRCFAMPNKSCNNTQPVNQLPICEAERNQANTLNENLTKLFKNLEDNDTLSFLHLNKKQLLPDSNRQVDKYSAVVPRSTREINVESSGDAPLDKLCMSKANIIESQCLSQSECSCPEDYRVVGSNLPSDKNISCVANENLVGKEFLTYSQRIVSCEGSSCLCPEDWEENTQLAIKQGVKIAYNQVVCFTNIDRNDRHIVWPAELEGDLYFEVEGGCPSNTIQADSYDRKEIDVTEENSAEAETSTRVDNEPEEITEFVQSLESKQLDFFKKFLDNWKKDIAKGISKQCKSPEHCQDANKSFAKLNTFIIDSIKPMFHFKEEK